MVARNLLTANAGTLVVQNARITMETAMAMRGSTVGRVRPPHSPLMEATVLPRSVSACSSTEILNVLRESRRAASHSDLLQALAGQIAAASGLASGVDTVESWRSPGDEDQIATIDVEDSPRLDEEGDARIVQLPGRGHAFVVLGRGRSHQAEQRQNRPDE